ncbi:hypothetical protein [Paraburkholderia nodosa]|uniref:hypothetical protein n=1 Tax=Paraburkholderia nodosa TaxID=392320 RepID=UPI0004826BF9
MHAVRKWIAGAAVIAVTAMLAPLLAPLPAAAQTNPGATPPAAPAASATPAGDGTFLLTIFLKHDESKPLPKINQQLAEQGFYKAFPPPGIEVVSWYVMMGIGQVVTLRVPADRLREVNRAIEQTAWGGYRTEFYPTYDYKALAEQARARNGK